MKLMAAGKNVTRNVRRKRLMLTIGKDELKPLYC